jgi:membrane associated rhomboid family serine protease
MNYYRYRFSFGYGLTPVIKNLMIIMGTLYFFQMFLEILQTDYATFISNWITIHFGLVPLLVWGKYFFWQLGTYIFLHGGFSHILFNLFSLWMFGGDLENHWGSRKFLFYFLFCGIGAGLCTVVITPYQFIPVIGASGAIYGILLAFGWLFPNRLIYVYFLFPIPAKYFVAIFGLLEFFFFSRGGTRGGIAHLTHLGGLVFGLSYMAYPVIRQKIRREYYKKKWSQKGPGGGGYYH